MDRRFVSVERLRSAAAYSLMLAAAVLCAIRAESLLLQGFETSSHTERRWFAWATEPQLEREELIRELQERRREHADSAAPVEISAPGGLREDLADVLTSYFFPRAEVVWSETGTDVSNSLETEIRDARPGSVETMSLSVGVLATILLGSFWLPRPWRPIDLAAAWALGCSAWLCVGGALASLGMPVGRPTALILWTAVLVVAFRRWPTALRRRSDGDSRQDDARQDDARPNDAATASALDLALQGLCGLSWALVVWKVVLTPLWSWDHWAIWGYKSRLLLEAGALEVLAERPIAAPQYPLGLPAAWNVMTGGMPIEAWQVKTLHLLTLTATGLLVGALARSLGASAVVSRLAVLVTWILPLAWSTEGVGLAEVFIAQTLLLVSWSIAVDPERLRSAPAATAIGLSALAFTKDEGLTLALLLLGVWLLTRVAARWRWSAVALGGIVLARGLAPPGGTPFAGGDWQGRLTARLAEPLGVLVPVAEELLRFEVLGVWLVAPLALGAALLRWRRRTLTALLLGVACAQLTAYVAIYFVTYLEPEAHVVSSLARIASALEPLVVAAAAATLAAIRPDAREDSLLE